MGVCGGTPAVFIMISVIAVFSYLVYFCQLFPVIEHGIFCKTDCSCFDLLLELLCLLTLTPAHWLMFLKVVR